MMDIKNNKGVTLIELVVVIAILGVVSIMAVDLFSYSMKAYKNDDVQWQIQQEARQALKVISKEVRAKSITNSTGNSLTLNLKDNTGEVSIIKCGDTSGDKPNTLFLITNGSPNIIANNIKSVNFNYDGNILAVTLTTKKTGSSNEFTVSTKLYSRISLITNP